MRGSQQAFGKSRLCYTFGLQPLLNYLSLQREAGTQYWIRSLAPETKLSWILSAAWKVRRSPCSLPMPRAWTRGFGTTSEVFRNTSSSSACSLVIFRIQPQWLDTQPFILLKGQRTLIKISKPKIVWRAKKQMRREACSLWFNNEFCIKGSL